MNTAVHATATITVEVEMNIAVHATATIMVGVEMNTAVHATATITVEVQMLAVGVEMNMQCINVPLQ